MPAARGAGRASFALLRPAALRSPDLPDRFGLPGHPPVRGRARGGGLGWGWGGVGWGQGLLRTRPRPPRVGAWVPSALATRSWEGLASELSGGAHVSTSGLWRMAQFQPLYSVPRLRSQIWSLGKQPSGEGRQGVASPATRAQEPGSSLSSPSGLFCWLQPCLRPCQVSPEQRGHRLCPGRLSNESLRWVQSLGRVNPGKGVPFSPAMPHPIIA